MLAMGTFQDLPNETAASRDAADYWRRKLRELGLGPAEGAAGGGEAQRAARQGPGAGETLPGGFAPGDTSGFHPGKDAGLIEGALKTLGADPGRDGNGISDLVGAVRDLRRGGSGGSDDQRRILATLIGPADASKVEAFTRNAARTGEASARQNADLAERSARLAEIRARERSAAAEKAENPAEAARLREAAQRLLDQAASKRKMAGGL